MALYRSVRTETIITTRVVFPDQDGDSIEVTTRAHDTRTTTDTRTVDTIAAHALSSHANSHATAVTAALKALDA